LGVDGQLSIIVEIRPANNWIWACLSADSGRASVRSNALL